MAFIGTMHRNKLNISYLCVMFDIHVASLAILDGRK